VPDWQETPIRVYKMGRPIANLIDAVLDPTARHDDELKEAADSQSAEILDEIRTLVCR
jgi:hypothetical protein